MYTDPVNLTTPAPRKNSPRESQPASRPLPLSPNSRRSAVPPPWRTRTGCASRASRVADLDFRPLAVHRAIPEPLARPAAVGLALSHLRPVGASDHRQEPAVFGFAGPRCGAQKRCASVERTELAALVAVPRGEFICADDPAGSLQDGAGKESGRRRRRQGGNSTRCAGCGNMMASAGEEGL